MNIFYNKINLIYCFMLRGLQTLLLILPFYGFNLFAENILLNQNYLKESEAFKLRLIKPDAGKIKIFFEIAEDHYLYANSIHLATDKKEQLPFNIESYGRAKTVDEFFGESDIYINQMNINIFTDNIIDDTILLSYQGCHDGKYCYPIITKKILINSLKIL